jgi:Collagen triple helix repeat (20 copies)
MLERLRTQIGTAGLIVAIVALVAALGGGAYAATGGNSGKATASAKQGKQGKQGKTGKTGPAGPAGAAGPAGPAGAKGETGAAGSNGAPGAAGKSVKVTPIAEGAAECEERGGALIKQEGAVSGTEVCTGEEGSPWTAGGTLPSGKTETGVWSFSLEGMPAPNAVSLPVSFTIPLENPLAANGNLIYVTAAESACNAKSEPQKAECLTQLAEHCPGTAASPQAAKGFLCAYQANMVKAPAIQNIQNLGKAGAVLNFVFVGEGASGNGTWAVTGL